MVWQGPQGKAGASSPHNGTWPPQPLTLPPSLAAWLLVSPTTHPSCQPRAVGHPWGLVAPWRGAHREPSWRRGGLGLVPGRHLGGANRLVPLPSPQRSCHGSFSPHCRRDGASSFVRPFCPFGAGGALHFCERGEQKETGPPRPVWPPLPQREPCSPLPAPRAGKGAVPPCEGIKPLGKIQSSLAFSLRSPQVTRHWGEAVWGRSEGETLGALVLGRGWPWGWGAWRKGLRGERSVPTADTAGLGAHHLKSKLITQGLFLAPAELSIAHWLHLYSSCCKKSYAISKRNPIPPPIFLQYSMWWGNWPLK